MIRWIIGRRWPLMIGGVRHARRMIAACAARRVRKSPADAPRRTPRVLLCNPLPWEPAAGEGVFHNTPGQDKRVTLRLKQLLAMASLALAVVAAPMSLRAAEPPASAAPAAANAPAPVAVAEAAGEADVVSANLKAQQARLADDEAAERIAAALPTFARDVDNRLRESSRILARRPSLDLLRTVEAGLLRIQRQASAWADELTASIGAGDRIAEQLDALDQTWQATLAAAREQTAPPEITRRIETLLGEIKQTGGAVDTQRSRVLRLQSKVALERNRVDSALTGIRTRRDQLLARIFEQDSPPIWEAALITQARAGVAEIASSLETQFETLRLYVNSEAARFMAHGVLLIALTAALWALRRTARARPAGQAGMRETALALATPWATALVISIFAARGLYPDAPRILWALLGAVALIPTVLILRRLIAPALVSVLYAVVCFYAADQARAVLGAVAGVPRLLFLVEMIGGALFLWWFFARRLPQVDAPGAGRFGQSVRWVAWVALAFFIVTAVANALGYATLSNLLGNAFLSGTVYGLILFTLVMIAEALVALALASRPLMLLGMVREHAAVLYRRVAFLLRWVAGALWLVFMLDRLAIRDRVFGAVETALTAQATWGAISLSLGDVLAFIVTVWAAFALSRFVNFALEEDVYPRVHLNRGLPYAISKTLHYCIVLVGFFVAVAALGIDMTKFTILAGAFTVGVGFGLQNIFNNFVSGLILLFERPVQVGDMVQMDNAAGIVERIGIRASVVRTTAGSEIIVPNGKLISERLINWTFTSRQRGIEIPIALAHGADPVVVIALFNGVAAAHPDVTPQPAPQTLLVRLGPDYLGFELRAWTTRIEEWLTIRSDISVAIGAALKERGIALK